MFTQKISIILEQNIQYHPKYFEWNNNTIFYKKLLLFFIVYDYHFNL